MNEDKRTLQTRNRIREAAGTLFLKGGFQGTSTDAILAASGVASKETLYRHYPRKEELFVDVLRSLTVEGSYLKGLMEGEPSPRSPDELRDLLREVAVQALDTMLQPDYLALIRTTMAELPRFPELGQLFRRTVPERALGYLQSLLLNGRRAGVVRADKDPEVIGRMFLGTLLTYAIFDGLFLPDRFPRAPGKSKVEAIVGNLMDIVSVPGSKLKSKSKPEAEKPLGS